MRKEARQAFVTTGILAAVYVLFTLLVRFVDVRQIGPEGSSVGFAGLNGAVFRLFGGFHQGFYTVSRLLGYLLLLLAVCVALLAVFQLVQKKSLRGVNWDLKLYILYGVLVLAVYVFTSKVSINSRPVITDAAEGLEKSYPSSHTLLAVCVAGALLAQIQLRIREDTLRRILTIAAWVLAGVTVLARLLAGVHWLTDIIGGVLLGLVLVGLYRAMIKLKYRKFR